MIAFATLFLGLVLGQQTVEVSVGDDVASVVLQIDGNNIVRLTEAPWRTVIDFGNDLIPHRFEAIALDPEGQELGRALQWINLPQPPARASVVVEAATEEQPPIAKLTWESVAGSEPVSLLVSFDGRPLAVEDPRRVELPRFNPDRLHFLRAELTFSENVTSIVEATLGGIYSDQVSTELTAIAVQLEKGRPEPTLASLENMVFRRGKPVRVVAVDHAAASVLVVPDRNLASGLKRLQNKAPASGGLIHPASPRHPLRFWSRVAGAPSLRVVWPMHRQQAGASIAFQLFATSQDIDGGSLGMLNLLLLAQHPPDLGDAPQRLADAIAVAGMEAAGRRRPRAVVLVVGEEPVEASVLDMTQARKFLERLQVPLYLWALHRNPKIPESWGTFKDVSRPGAFEAAARKLGRTLERQRMIWLDGTHLPQEISLSPSLEGVTLAR